MLGLQFPKTSTAARKVTMSTSATVPPAVRNWLKSQYRGALIKESWLAQTVASAPGSTTAPALVQHVKQAVLTTSLTESLESGALANSKGKNVIPDGVLLEIVGKLDIGISAQTQLDVLEARSQARQTAGGAAELEEANKANGDDGNEQTDHMADFNAAEEAASLPATVFPRSSTMQLTLSDGFTSIQAFEHRRLPWLTMTDPPLGSKVVLRGAKVQSGHVLLTPECIELKGGKVESLDSDWEDKMIDELRQKLGKPPRTKRPKAKDVEGSDEPRRVVPVADADEDEEAALFEAMQGGDASTKRSQADASGSATTNASTKRLKLPPKSSALTSGALRASAVQAEAGTSVATPTKALHTQTDSTKSPYFANAKAQPSSDNEPPTTLQADSEDFFKDEEDDFEMLLPNDVANPIVLSDSE